MKMCLNSIVIRENSNQGNINSYCSHQSSIIVCYINVSEFVVYQGPDCFDFFFLVLLLLFWGEDFLSSLLSQSRSPYPHLEGGEMEAGEAVYLAQVHMSGTGVEFGQTLLI